MGPEVEAASAIGQLGRVIFYGRITVHEVLGQSFTGKKDLVINNILHIKSLSPAPTPATHIILKIKSLKNNKNYLKILSRPLDCWTSAPVSLATSSYAPAVSSAVWYSLTLVSANPSVVCKLCLEDRLRVLVPSLLVARFSSLNAWFG